MLLTELGIVNHILSKFDISFFVRLVFNFYFRLACKTISHLSIHSLVLIYYLKSQQVLSNYKSVYNLNSASNGRCWAGGQPLHVDKDIEITIKIPGRSQHSQQLQCSQPTLQHGGGLHEVEIIIQTRYLKLYEVNRAPQEWAIQAKLISGVPQIYSHCRFEEGTEWCSEREH